MNRWNLQCASLVIAVLLSHSARAQVPSTETLVFSPVADAYVESSSPSVNFNTDARLRADAVPVRISYLRFAVSGVNGRRVQQAHLRLEVSGASAVSGGIVHGITAGAWDESTLTYNNHPPVDGPGLASLDGVAIGAIVDFDVTAGITADGVYDLAIDTLSDDAVSYVSSAATSGQKPTLVLTVAAGSNPTVGITQPANGSTFFVGDPIVLQGTASDPVDGNLSAAIRWSSSLQGLIGTGAALTPTLIVGSHLVTAAVTDGDGLHGSAQIGITVRAPSGTNAVPVVTVIAPRDGRTATAGERITFMGIADDREDGLVTARLVWTSDRDGTLGSVGSFAQALSAGTHRITAAATDSGGLQGAAMVTVNVVASTTFTFAATQDTYVDANRPTKKYGSASVLTAQGSPLRQAFLRFALSGVPPDGVAQALLRLTVGSGSSDGSSIGGTVYAISSNSWSESTTTFATRPVVDGLPLVTRGPVTTNQVVDFDVSPAVDGSGSYNFAVVSTATDALRYRSREASIGKPQLVVTLGSPHITLTGTYSDSFTDGTLEPDTTIDASAATFLGSPTNSYPISLGGGPGVWLTGGAVLGQYDRSWTWDQMHTENNAAVVFDSDHTTVDGMRIDDVTDGIRPQKGGFFVVRNVRLSYVRDDCIENDHLHGALVDESLFDGCYSAFSARPSPAIIAGGADGSREVWRIQNSLIRLQPMPGPDGGSTDGLGTGGFFKWDSWNDPTTSLSPKLALVGNIFMAERVGQVGPSRMGIPPGQVVSCANNVMVWLGPGDFPAPLPVCFTVTKDRAVWDNAVADWVRRHPQVRP